MSKRSPIFLLDFGGLLRLLFSLAFSSFLFVGFLLFSSKLLLLASDGFQVTSNEQINEFFPFLVLLESSSEDHDFSSQHPEDCGNSLGYSVVAGDDNIDEFKRSVSVAKRNSGNVNV